VRFSNTPITSQDMRGRALIGAPPMALNTSCRDSGDYYVYVYIDPRNFEEFYYGKGKGSRKEAHLSDIADTEKTRRIAAIHKAGLDPIIRVIAKDLSEREAFMIEKTLLWKLGKQLTNISSGFFADRFRPHDTFHIALDGFDYQRGIYYYNVGEDEHRCWDDYARFGFISAGQGKSWRDAMLGFKEGDIVAAYLKGQGYVGIGQVTAPARPIREVMIDNKPLLALPLSCTGMADNVDSDELCEYVALVQWLAKVDRTEAKWRPKSGLYTTTHIRALLTSQPDTIAFLEEAFELQIRDQAQ